MHVGALRCERVYLREVLRATCFRVSRDCSMQRSPMGYGDCANECSSRKQHHLRSNYVVDILSNLDRELPKPSSLVALPRHPNALVPNVPPRADPSIAILTQE